MTRPVDVDDHTQPRHRIRPLRATVAHATGAVDRLVQAAMRTVTAVTDKLDERSADRLILGQVVATTTDVADAALDTIASATDSALARDGSDHTPIFRPVLDAATSLGGPETAPELASGGAPTPPGAGSGAHAFPLPSALVWQHPDAGRHTASDVVHAHAHHRAHLAISATAGSTAPRKPSRDGITSGNDVETIAAPTVKPIDGTLADHVAPAPHWQQTVIGYIHHHSGRTQRPRVPSG